MKRFNERIDMDLDLHIEAKRSTLKKFINDAVSYFTSRNCVPTFEQVYDYISTDRWAKSNIYNGSDCTIQQRDFECLSIKDMCENIINLCSFNLADMYESKNSKSIRLRICEDVDEPISIQAAELGTMSKEDRLNWLQSAPDDSRIYGLINKRTGEEVIVRKRCGYVRSSSYLNTYDSRNFGEWLISGYADPIISTTIKQATNGTNRYYEVS